VTVTPLQQTFTVIGLVGGLLLPLTFTLLHLRQADAAGGFGTVAYVLTMLFSTMLAGAYWSFAFVFPSLSSAQLDLFNNTTPAALSVGFYVTFSGSASRCCCSPSRPSEPACCRRSVRAC
jgi:predicted membrane-bound spermidine synthase